MWHLQSACVNLKISLYLMFCFLAHPSPFPKPRKRLCFKTASTVCTSELRGKTDVLQRGFFHLLDSRQLTWAAISSGPKRKATKPRPPGVRFNLAKKHHHHHHRRHEYIRIAHHGTSMHTCIPYLLGCWAHRPETSEWGKTNNALINHFCSILLATRSLASTKYRQ